MKTLFLAAAMVTLGWQAQAKTESKLKLNDGKIFAPLQGSPATAGYGTLENSSDKDLVISIDKAAPFKAVEMHRTFEKDGKMAMEKVDTFTIPAKGSLEFKQGGNHLMLFEPSREVKMSEKIKVRFKVDGKNQEFPFKVVPRVEAAAEEYHHHH